MGDFMNKEKLENLRIWATLLVVEKQLEFKNVLIKDDFIELSRFIQNLINRDLIEYNQGNYLLTDKGIHTKKKLERRLELKGGNKFIVPNFNILIASIDQDSVYLP